MSAVTVVVADDHPIWRSGIRSDLGDGFVVVGEAEDAPSAIDEVRRSQPDVVLCDLHMPGGGGVAVAEAVGAQCPVVILTVSESERDVLDAVAAGAVGYLVKSARPDELRSALTRSAAGEPVFSPQLAALLIGEYRRLATSGPAGSTLPLSEREREVLALIVHGLTNKEVGRALALSPRTVETHRAHLFDKLEAPTLAHLIRHYAALVDGEGEGGA